MKDRRRAAPGQAARTILLLPAALVLASLLVTACENAKTGADREEEAMLNSPADEVTLEVCAAMDQSLAADYPAGQADKPYRALILLDNGWGANLTIEDDQMAIITQLEHFGWELTFVSWKAELSACHYARSTRRYADVGPIQPVERLDAIERYDALIVAPGQKFDGLESSAEIMELIRKADSAGLALAAFCRGVRVLAAAGVLSGKTISGHPDYAGLYAAAGASFIDYSDHGGKSDAPPPLVDGRLVTGVRSKYYRTAMCEAIRLAASSARRGRNASGAEPKAASAQDAPPQRVMFATMIGAADADQGLLLARSLRRFGGRMADAPFVLLVAGDLAAIPEQTLRDLRAERCELRAFVPDPDLARIPFSGKVKAAAEAEILAAQRADILVWMDCDTLILREPTEVLLADGIRFAASPVHHRLIGSVWDSAPDTYWQRVYRYCGVPPAALFAVPTVVEQEAIRPYFNAGMLAVRPESRILRVWSERFRQSLTGDDAFKPSGLQATFHHQAILAAVAVALAGPEGIRCLSAAYNYPLHLHGRVPAVRQARKLDDLVTARYDTWPQRPRAAGYAVPAQGSWLEFLASFAE